MAGCPPNTSDWYSILRESCGHRTWTFLWLNQDKKEIKMLFIISASCLILVQKKSTIIWEVTFKKKGGEQTKINLTLLSLAIPHCRSHKSIVTPFARRPLKEELSLTCLL